MRNRLTAVIVGVFMLALLGTAVAHARVRAAAVVRQTWTEWIRAEFAGDPRGCTLLDGRFRRQFVSLARRTFRSPVRNCADAVRAYSALIHDVRARLGSQLKVVARARITVQGQRAILVDATDRVIFVNSSGRWLIDRWPRG